MNMRTQAGSMLIEALSSSFILGFGALAVIKMQTNLANTSVTAKQQIEAVKLAKLKIESLRQIDNKDGYDNITTNYDFVYTNNTKYTRVWLIDNNLSENYKKVHVKIYWHAVGDYIKNVDLSSVIAEPNYTYSGQLLAEKEQAEAPNGSGGAPRSPLIPTEAVDQNDGTSDYTVPDQEIVLTYHNETGEVIEINGADVLMISGSALKGTGGLKPQSVDFSEMNIDPMTNGSGSIYCTVTNSATSFNYECIASHGWSGYMVLIGVNENEAIVCEPEGQPYTNLVVDLSQQNYTLIKANKSCSQL